jgi:hypothetical protein
MSADHASDPSDGAASPPGGASRSDSGLNPVFRDILRICRLECVFDLDAYEAGASRTAARRLEV